MSIRNANLTQEEPQVELLALTYRCRNHGQLVSVQLCADSINLDAAVTRLSDTFVVDTFITIENCPCGEMHQVQVISV